MFEMRLITNLYVNKEILDRDPTQGWGKLIPICEKEEWKNNTD